jgi:hypothetical protein
MGNLCPIQPKNILTNTSFGSNVSTNINRVIKMYKTIYTEVEVDVDLSDFDTDDLIEELESRGSAVMDYGDGKEVLESIYQKRRLGQDYQTELETLIYLGLGRII